MNLLDNAEVKAVAGRHAGTTGLTVTGDAIDMANRESILGTLRIATTAAAGGQLVLTYQHSSLSSAGFVDTLATKTVTVSTGTTESGNVISIEVVRPRKRYGKFTIVNPSSVAAPADGVIGVLTHVRKGPITQAPITGPTFVSPAGAT